MTKGATGAADPADSADSAGSASPVRRAAVLGSPIAHSLSPVLHRAAYARLGLTGWTYGRHEVDEAALPAFLNALDRDVGEGADGSADLGDSERGTWAGLSLTMPLKRAVIPLLDEVDPTALAVNAVNTLIFRADGSRYGANTDVTGFTAALRERGVTEVRAAAVLGAGATAGSALAALSELVKGPITVFLRNPARLAEFEDLVRHFGLDLDPRPWPEAHAAATDFDLVVNTTPAGAADHLADHLPPSVGTLFDVLYHPWPTPLAAAWAARGGAVLGGRDLLVHQAVRQVELMTGIEGRDHEILAAMREALA